MPDKGLSSGALSSINFKILSKFFIKFLRRYGRIVENILEKICLNFEI